MAQVFSWQLKVDPASAAPMWSQIADGICRDLVRFRPEVGTVVVSERQLAADLKLHRNTVRQAYAELRAKNILMNRNCRTIAVGPGAKELFKKPFPTITLIFNQPFSEQLKAFSRQGLEVFGGIMERASALGISVNIAALPPTDSNAEVIDNWINEIWQHSIGVVNFCPRHVDKSDTVFDRLADLRGLPQVLVSAKLDDDSISSACEDYLSGFSEALEYLKRSGHRKIAVFEQQWDSGRFISTAVLRGKIMYEQSLQHGFEAKRIIYDKPDAEQLESRLDDMFSTGFAPTAIWCQNDHCAMILYELLEKRNIRVPEDISLIGFDNDTDGFLASVNYSRTALGAELVELLWLLHNYGSGDTVIHRTVPSKFYPNKTIAEVKK